MDLVGRMLGGDRLALARLITRVENRLPDVPDIMRAVHPRTGRAYVLGVTGPPGAGKSTLVDRLTARLRTGGASVGVIAVDPSSPFTGGAVLGDRIRMQAHTLDPGVFIRSMATRGSLGGLARATGDVIKLMDAFGFPWIILETVGVGQTELDVIRQADTTVVALVPESGDSIQAMKAGLMEVADIFVVNKADRAGVDATRRDLEQMLDLSDLPRDAWRPPIVPAVATTREGVVDVWDAIGRHREYATNSGQLTERRAFRTREELREIVAQRLREKARDVCTGDRWDALSGSVVAHTVDPWTAADEMLAPVDA